MVKILPIFVAFLEKMNFTHSSYALSTQPRQDTALHPSTALSVQPILSVLSVNYMALATETRSYPPPIFILFFTDSRLRREGGELSEKEGMSLHAIWHF